ncbi:MAG TPA: hypothetical protein VGG29_05620 [Caulobacteraceae bacterium]|jgi:hypothetical protein
MTKLYPLQFTALAAVVALAACGGGGARAGGSHSSADNPLLGKWHLSSYVANGATPDVTCGWVDLVFTPNQQILIDAHGSQAPGPVTYNYVPGGSSENVIGSSGGFVIYKLLGPDDIEQDSAYTNCKYHRAG